jgi:sulfide:quinone oxidoreductase
MTGKKVLILGGGFGGLTVAQKLRQLLPSEHRIVVIEKKATFYINAFNIRLLTGEMKDPREGQRNLSELSRKDIDWVQAEIDRIEPAEKRLHTFLGDLEGDYMVVALGADRHPDSVPGCAEAAYNLYDASGAVQLREAIEKFESGRIVIACCSTPFSCPGAPYEAAFVVDSILRSEKKRLNAAIALYTPEPRPFPATGTAIGEAMLALFSERNIEFYPRQKILRIDGSARKLVLESGEAPYDLLIGIPLHTAPLVVRDAGLTDETGWVPADIQTFETSYSGVFAIGDITSIRQPNPTGFFLPKSWVVAEEEARIVARNIADRILGLADTGRYNGDGFCYWGTGDDMAAYFSGNFYGYPAPRVYLQPPSKQFLRERRELERDRLQVLV